MGGRSISAFGERARSSRHIKRGLVATLTAALSTALGTALFGPLPASAQTLHAGENSGLQVNFSGPKECAPELLRQSAQRLLGGAAETADVRVEASVTQDQSGYRLELRFEGSVDGTRSLTARRCVEVLEAGSVVVALAIDPRALEHAALDAPPARSADAAGSAPTGPTLQPASDSVSPEDAVLPAPSAESPPRPPQSPLQKVQTSKRLQERPSEQDALKRANLERGTSLEGSTALLATVESGLTPGAFLGARVGAGLQGRLLRAQLHGTVYPVQFYEAPAAGRVSAEGWAVGADGCLVLMSGSAGALRVCGGLRVTRLVQRARELSVTSDRAATLLAFSLGSEGRVHCYGPLSLAARVGVDIPTTHPRFVVAAESGALEPVHRVGTGLFAALGGELTF